MTVLGVHDWTDLKVGDMIPVAITRPWGGDEIIVSLRLGLQQQDWLCAERLVETDDLVTCEVIGANRGGVLARFGRLDAFVPNSHLGRAVRSLPSDELAKIKEEMMGQILSLSVIEVNQDRRRLVLSRRVAERQQRQDLLGELAPGQVRVGRVSSIVSFGAFVDLGGIDGLVHISELDWEYIENPADVVHVGDQIEVYVLSVDSGRQRIGLSRKHLMSDPWDLVSARLSEVT